MFNIPEKFCGSDWFIGLTVGIILLIMAQINLLQPLEQLVYDWNIQQMSRNPGDKVAIIAIDDISLEQFGDWPWSRTLIAQMIDLLAPHTQVIGNTIDFSKSQKHPGQLYIDELIAFYANSKPLNLAHKQLEQLDNFMDRLAKVRTRYSGDRRRIKKFGKFYNNSALVTKLPEALTTLEDKLQAASVELDSDQRLANSFKQADNVILGMPFILGKLNESSAAPSLPDFVQKHAINTIRAPFDNPDKVKQPLSCVNIIPPLAILGNSVSGIGHFNSEFNSRQIPLVIKYRDSYIASLPLALASKSLNINHKSIEVELGKGIRLGQLQVNTDASLSMRPFFYHDTPLVVDSFIDVLLGRIPVTEYQNKIVLLGMTSSFYSSTQSTPLGEMPAVLVLAHTLTSLLNQDFFIIPNWAIWLQISLFITMMIYVSFLLPHLKWRTALALSCSAIMVLILLYFALLNQGFLVQLMPSGLLILFGHFSLQIKRGIVAYQDAFRLHPEAVESNRLLGLAFQGQGQLDLAFEKFRLCPPDEVIMSLLYNLALDYERKRELKRAATVFRYMIRHEPKFRDIEQRLEQLFHLKKPKLTGSNLTDWQFEDDNEKPSLGRYQIEKRLGKGAMGIVYLGKDSKLDRLVAIKTLPLSQEFEDEELQEATIRFFREASAAGRLKHSHIVAIYDAGEEQDLAYISMEFFKGGNLIPYTQKNNLLAISTTIKIVINAAKALDYAHNNGVIHRDIKPANIMYNPATDKIKITDFGIAHITDSNKTKTGVILGTPSYMSPEQLAGKPIDGRTDLFSLGVMLYQLLTGQLPFQAESMATLMFKIANDPHPDILTHRADLPHCLKHVVDIAMQKNASERYQSGAEFANALSDCMHGEL